MNDFCLEPGDRVEHIGEPGYTGTLMSIDIDCHLFHQYGITTCLVEWDDCKEQVDIQ